MSTHVVYSCDGLRSGQPCRGALHTRTDHAVDADREAVAAGWRSRLVIEPGSAPTRYRPIDRCPSPGHDEDRHADDRPRP